MRVRNLSIVFCNLGEISFEGGLDVIVDEKGEDTMMMIFVLQPINIVCRVHTTPELFKIKK